MKWRNQGIEVDLKIRPIIRAGKFTWEASGNYTYLTNKVLSLYGDLDRLNIRMAAEPVPMCMQLSVSRIRPFT